MSREEGVEPRSVLRVSEGTVIPRSAPSTKLEISRERSTLREQSVADAIRAWPIDGVGFGGET